MAHLYFDESIRDNGDFIIGALILSVEDLSQRVRDLWLDMGLDPDTFEFKSSSLKTANSKSQEQRYAVKELLHSSQLALTVCPRSDRKQLGTHSSKLILQLIDKGLLPVGEHYFYIDQNIEISRNEIADLAARGVTVNANQDSRIAAGIQVADYAAHSLGGMLLEEMGIITKKVFVGEASGYDPTHEVELGVELWASLRYALLGINEHIEGLSPTDDLAHAYFRVEGYGLYVAGSCSENLAVHARKVFGVNYLGCLH